MVLIDTPKLDVIQTSFCITRLDRLYPLTSYLGWPKTLSLGVSIGPSALCTIVARVPHHILEKYANISICRTLFATTTCVAFCPCSCRVFPYQGKSHFTYKVTITEIKRDKRRLYMYKLKILFLSSVVPLTIMITLSPAPPSANAATVVS